MVCLFVRTRLLPAFQTRTGIPYGTVNLLSGVPEGETTIASLAGGGTLSIEMQLLSRLTGNPSYGRAAKLAARALWVRRSQYNLLGKHICTRKGEWTESLSGIGEASGRSWKKAKSSNLIHCHPPPTHPKAPTLTVSTNTLSNIIFFFQRMTIFRY